jgi:Mce-associated membrane protein
VQPPPARSAKLVWLRWLPAGVAAALVVALAIVDVVMLQNWRNQPNRAERREQLVASVNAGVTKLLSYDYRHLDQDEAAVSGRLTGKFRDDYVQSMDSTIKKKAPSEKAVVVGEVSSTAITSVSGDGKQAVLLVLGQQTITNTKQTTPRNELVQLRVTAQLVHGKWLVSDLASL